MAKKKTIFECEHCGHIVPKWTGKCSQCDSWNSFFETDSKINKASSKINLSSVELSLTDIESKDFPRFKTSIEEVNRVLGGGIVPGSVIVIGGSPGIGKSTLILQVLNSFAISGQDSLYFSGEESPNQIKMRAERLNAISDKIVVSTSIDIDEITQIICKKIPAVVVIDSIQTVYSEQIDSVPGSLTQIRHTTFELVKLAKEKHIPIFIIGHITKDGQIAGPKILEHMVDVVLYFEGEQYSNFRLLRTFKNRFGATNELGIFSMTSAGLAEENDPSKHFLNSSTEAGIAIACVREGSRFLFVEVQALVAKATYGVPQRVVNGYDQKRLAVILAVLEKKADIFLGDQDVFVKVAGAMKVTDPSLDLAIALSIWSSYANKPVSNKLVSFGELSLTGNIQKSQMVDDRIKETETYGFKEISGNFSDASFSGKQHAVKHISDLNDLLFN